MNYINYFQKGGSVQPSPQEVIGGALEILGIDQKTAVSKLEQIAQSGDEETLQSIYNASAIILQTAQNPTQESQQAAQYLTEIFGSKMFKCGGKLQSLVDRFAKGGKSKCGCGKKIRKGQDGLVSEYEDPDLAFRYGEYPTPTTPVQKPTDGHEFDSKNFSFKDAFKEARSMGLKTFKWKGNLYNTKLASAPASASTPAPTPTTIQQAVASAITSGLGTIRNPNPTNFWERAFSVQSPLR